MMTHYQLSAERKLLGCLMDKFVNRTVLLTQIPERLFTGNNVLLYRAIESLHKAEREIDVVTIYKYLADQGQANVLLHVTMFYHHQNSQLFQWNQHNLGA